MYHTIGEAEASVTEVWRKKEISADNMDNNIGKKLDGRYELLELIGVGGMADIYRARDIQEDRVVAVKILKTEYAGSEEFLRRFRNESKAIALLSHPNIVKIYDVGFTDKVQFIVMEYVDGITLSDYIEQQGVLKWRDAIHFTVQTLKALQHAHDRGIVHRDIKSSNIMLLRDGTIKVMDFGIARFNRENNKTMSEKTIGSVHYISPEQARGDMTDERSDIYSVGVALYEMLTGKKPFDGDTPVAIALMHMQTDPKKPSEVNETIPEGLEQIVLKAMQKDPNARYQTALEMITDLEEFKKNPGMVFDYKYNSTDGTPKFTGINPLTEQTDGFGKKQPHEPDDLVVDDDEDYDDDDEAEERRSPLIPILFAVGAAFVIGVVFLVLTMVSNRIGGQPVTSSGANGSGYGEISINPNGEFELPNFVGRQWDEVSKVYADKSVLVLTGQEEWNEAPKGEIFKQDLPEGRSVMKGSNLTLYVSKGIQQREIEDMSDRTVDAAKKQLEKNGFKVSTSRQEHDTIAKDHVISTIPEAHTMAPVGSTVVLIVSSGPNDKPFAMPKLVDMNIDDALKRCTEYNLNAKVENKPSLTEKGTVLEQSIAPETMAYKGDEITLVVSTGETPEIKKEVTIPLPQTATGDFRFKFYVGGELDEDATRIVNIGFLTSKTLTYEITGKDGDEKSFAITAMSTATQKEDVYYTATITFEEENAKLSNEVRHSEIFDQLQQSDTSSEPVSQPTSEPTSQPTSEPTSEPTSSDVTAASEPDVPQGS